MTDPQYMLSRKDFFAKRDEIAKTKRRLQREKNGYIPRAPQTGGLNSGEGQEASKTKSLHHKTVKLWLNFTADPENGFEYYKTSLGCPAPSHDMIKQFIRWYTSSIQGRLNEDELPTVRTWIKNTLTADGIVIDQKKEKLNFTKQDFLITVSSLWQTDHQKFIPGLLKVFVLFALQLYLFTGARVGSFIQYL
ncbi:unnamed protein product [Penicillium roqueforti FM164]|uniref:Genomic scaffold, ProqFM164S03 n=1 Tax=Penicillium roqueforti (strain FM164) TaxID=1365484 RepID=W6QDS9_PENRF|nr:unnamed protein product [Penicillium roqueforti FM164]